MLIKNAKYYSKIKIKQKITKPYNKKSEFNKLLKKNLEKLKSKI